MIDPYVFCYCPENVMGQTPFLITNMRRYTIESSALDSYCNILWVSNAPECILNKLLSSQLASIG